MGFFKKDETKDELEALQRQLEQTERAIENLIRAIEAGIINEATKKRMSELEAQQKELAASIADREIAKSLHITKEYVGFFFRQFRNKNYNDPECRKQLVDTFVNSVFVYDDYLIINFNFSSDSQTVKFSDMEELSEAESASDTTANSTGKVFVRSALCSANEKKGSVRYLFLVKKALFGLCAVAFAISARLKSGTLPPASVDSTDAGGNVYFVSALSAAYSFIPLLSPVRRERRPLLPRSSPLR